MYPLLRSFAFRLKNSVYDQFSCAEITEAL